jgi:hypothetical protein
VSAKELWPAKALLARWFRFQPSELDNMEAADIGQWVKHAAEQIKRENPE